MASRLLNKLNIQESADPADAERRTWSIVTEDDWFAIQTALLFLLLLLLSAACKKIILAA